MNLGSRFMIINYKLTLEHFSIIFSRLDDQIQTVLTLKCKLIIFLLSRFRF